MTPTRDQLHRAHRASDLRGSLDEALRSPLLARCLAITAEALRAAPAARTPQQDVVGAPFTPPHPNATTRDFKRACAADTDD
jgi:hypothetical protein